MGSRQEFEAANAQTIEDIRTILECGGFIEFNGEELIFSDIAKGIDDIEGYIVGPKEFGADIRGAISYLVEKGKENGKTRKV